MRSEKWQKCHANWGCRILRLLKKRTEISPDLRWHEQKYHHSLPCFWSNHWESPIHRFHGGEFLEGFSISKLKVNSRSKWSLEVRPCHFAYLFGFLPPSNCLVKPDIAFYNLSYACGIQPVGVPDRSRRPEPPSYGPMDARALWTTCRTHILFSYKRNFPFVPELFSACLWDSLQVRHTMHLKI